MRACSSLVEGSVAGSRLHPQLALRVCTALPIPPLRLLHSLHAAAARGAGGAHPLVPRWIGAATRGQVAGCHPVQVGRLLSAITCKLVCGVIPAPHGPCVGGCPLNSLLPMVAPTHRRSREQLVKEYEAMPTKEGAGQQVGVSCSERARTGAHLLAGGPHCLAAGNPVWYTGRATGSPPAELPQLVLKLPPCLPLCCAAA